MKEILEVLKRKNAELLSSRTGLIEFVKDNKIDKLLNDIEKHPHVFVLGCLMDRQIESNRAWTIPYIISKEIGGAEFEKFSKLTLEETENIFRKKRLHRFNAKMSKVFHGGIGKIKEDCNGDASNIWKGNPSSATVVKRFLEFKGAGIKIASMAANILSRDFKIPMSDKYSIEISPDALVKRVFTRAGFIGEDASNEILIYRARELNPEYPGLIDLAAWDIGNKWCGATKTDCEKCCLDKVCKKKGV